MRNLMLMLALPGLVGCGGGGVTPPGGPVMPDALTKIENLSVRSSPAAYGPLLVDKNGQTIHYRIMSDSRITAVGTTVGTPEARTVTFAKEDVDSVWHVTDVQGAEHVRIARFGYQLVFRVTATDTTPRIKAVLCGLAVTDCTSNFNP